MGGFVVCVLPRGVRKFKHLHCYQAGFDHCRPTFAPLNQLLKSCWVAAIEHGQGFTFDGRLFRQKKIFPGVEVGVSPAWLGQIFKLVFQLTFSVHCSAAKYSSMASSSAAK